MEDLEKMLNGMSIYVRRAWDAKMPVGWEIPPRYIYDFELLYVKEGELLLTIDNQTFEGVEGDLFFIPPGKIHHIKSIGSSMVRQPHIHFDFYFDEKSEDLEIPLTMPKNKLALREAFLTEVLTIPYKMTFKSHFEVSLYIHFVSISLRIS